MTKIIGLTGGIGSGKSTVAREFLALGIPVYFADVEAKKLLDETQVQQQLKAVFGEEIFDQAAVNKAKLAAIVFTDSSKLQQLNSIIHPAVQVHFTQWLSLHSHQPFVVKEAAILFESGSAAQCDYVVSVQAPKADRVARVMARDQVSEAQVLSRMQHQWTDEQRAKKSDFIINNLSQETLKNQVLTVLHAIQITNPK
jgi:dephospho-CoA kinase